MTKSYSPLLSLEDQRRIAELCPHLTELLQVEIKAGNHVVETWEHFGFCVLLAKPFQTGHIVDESQLKYREVNDPHYWKAEFQSLSTNQILACRF